MTTSDDPDNTPAEPDSTERAATTEEQLRAAHVQPLVPLNGPIYLAEYDPEWPRLYAREAERIRAALGDRVRLLEHAGSTAVPGLAAKPRIDIVLAVPDSADETAYLPALRAVGYTLAIREPEWFEHRVCKGPDTDVNLHIFSDGCDEIARMLRFRDWLRTHDDDRQLYARTKRELAARTWRYTQHYADAKSVVVRAILARAEAAEAGS
ncbi:MAG TPA: GrpB family protein [Ktedonobacterales bacterium]